MSPTDPTWGKPGRLAVLIPACGHPRAVRWAIADTPAAVAAATLPTTTCPKPCLAYGTLPQPIVSARWA